MKRSAAVETIEETASTENNERVAGKEKPRKKSSFNHKINNKKNTLLLYCVFIFCSVIVHKLLFSLVLPDTTMGVVFYPFVVVYRISHNCPLFWVWVVLR